MKAAVILDFHLHVKSSLLTKSPSREKTTTNNAVLQLILFRGTGTLQCTLASTQYTADLPTFPNLAENSRFFSRFPLFSLYFPKNEDARFNIAMYTLHEIQRQCIYVSGFCLQLNKL